MEDTKALKGGEFLVRDISAKKIFIPEEFDEEQNMIAQSCKDFLNAEIIPIMDKIDSNEPGLMRELISKAGELGLLGITIPEEYGGFDQSFLTAMRASEAIGASNSYSVAFMAHTGIGTMPLLYYGNDEQKQRYLSKLATGEIAAAYCLTEPNAGSDANSGKTKAILTEDGKHYILNGQKMWITNGGFAELQTVFAKIENDRILSAFLVERDYPGVSFSPEEKKMGIKGSSTVQIFYNDVKVPVNNLLGKRGEGFRIALNILHIGRIKLAANVIGAGKATITHSVNYANERKQFGTEIANFGAIKYKLAEQVIKVFATESATYRASYDIDNAIQRYRGEGMDKDKANIAGASNFAVECALLKLFGSQALDYIVDEAVQIHGGMGFSAETEVERSYRDSRINRIFEGTNEINRLLVVDTAMKGAMKGDFDLFGNANAVMDELPGLPEFPKPIENENYYEEKREYVRNFKKAALMLIKSCSEKFQRKLLFEQEILNNISDIITELYVAESLIARVEKLEGLKIKDNIDVYKDIVDVFVYDTAGKINLSGREAIYSFAESDQQDLLLKGLRNYILVAGVNVKEARRRIADKLIDDNKYSF
ncbi:MAG: acyl-CoA dehydrogenase family protein [Bacteroidota bacterium]